MYLRIDDTVIKQDETDRFKDEYGNWSQDLRKDYKVSISLGDAGDIEFTKGRGGISPEHVHTKWKTSGTSLPSATMAARPGIGRCFRRC